MALIITDLTKSFGIRTLFSDVSFELRRKDKVGLVGANGSGKTTLVRCLLGQETIDVGTVNLTGNEIIGYVEQQQDQSDRTLYQELCTAYSDVLAAQAEMRRLETIISDSTNSYAAEQALQSYATVAERFERGGGYEMESRLRRVAVGLGFSEREFERKLSDFSGGQKTRIALARALIRQPDYLILDEPTNHLDVTMVEWLEQFLVDYPGGVLVISHDRQFLDSVVGRILDLDGGKLRIYSGGYSEFRRQKAERQQALTASYEQQQEYIAKTQAYIDRYRAGIKSKQARGRQSQLDRLERVAAPTVTAELQFTFPTVTDCAVRVAEAQAVTVCYGEQCVFKNLSFLLRRGERVALIGANGAGKSTLLKLFSGELAATKGGIKIGSRVKLGYFDQEHQGLQPTNTVLSEVVNSSGLNLEQCRTLLGRFLFSGDDVFKPIAQLSGGEKARVALLKLLLSGANFLVLDEPTNHLDIPAREAVEAALLAYKGTLLVVSHDRYFLSKLAERILVLKDQELLDFAGAFKDYCEQNKYASTRMVATAKRQSAAIEPTTPPLNPVRERPEEQMRKLAKLELTIREQEGLLKLLAQQLNDPIKQADPKLSFELAEEYGRLEAEIKAKYDLWLELVGDD